MPVQIGDCFHDPAFRFADGNVGNKLFVVLARSKADDYIVARTTSNAQRKSYDAGCHNDEPDPTFCIPKTPPSPFDVHTWVNLDRLYEFDRVQLVNRVQKVRNITKFGSVPHEILKDLMDCASRADDTLQHQATAIRDALAQMP